jgi:hypothetical protein
VTAFSYLMIVACLVLIWAGVTDQNPVSAVQAVLSGKKGSPAK